MSGIEVAGLVIGIVPIVVEIFKSYSVAQDRLKAFAHHAQVVYDVQLRYRVAATNFANDIQLLMKVVVEDARELSQMVDDPNHGGWKDASLEERLRSFLGRDHQVFEEVVVRIRDVLRETRARLSELGRGLVAGKNDSRTVALKRLYTAFNIAYKENAYRRWLENLDHWNKKLGRLRAQRCKLQKQRSYRADGLIRKSVPKRYADIRTTSQKLHDSLRDSWSCTNVSHVGHQAKLSLEAQAEYGTAQLDMVIACRRKAPLETLTGRHSTSGEPPIWLHVRSITTKDLLSHTASKSSALLDCLSTSLEAPSNSSALVSAVVSPSSVVHKVKKTLKRVRFDASADQTTPPDSSPRKTTPLRSSDQSTAVTFSMLNLKVTPSVCCHLSKACRSTPCKDISLGYLESSESPHSFRFIFYDAGRNTEATIAKNMPGRDSCSIRLKLATLKILHQLTLAHKLATAVLQYHSTSWLSQDWGLEDISYFTDTDLSTMDQTKTAEDKIAEALRTLHLSTQFPSDSSVTQNGPDSDPGQLKYMYGIRNLTLARLGVALLEIATRKELSSISLDPSVPAPHRIISARKILMEEPPSLATLGKRYIKMARKCIDCDFSCGEDLTDEALRSAVYTDVVCALEEMITDWKKFSGF